MGTEPPSDGPLNAVNTLKIGNSDLLSTSSSSYLHFFSHVERGAEEIHVRRLLGETKA